MLDRAIKLPPAMSAFNGAREAPRALVEQIIEELVRTLDTADGDPDLEDGNDDEPDDDAKGDMAWAELADRGRHYGASERIGNPCAHEDEEEDDFGEDSHDREMTNEDGSDRLMPTLPRYDLDQSRGPINEREGYLDWRRGEDAMA